jgi:hypothetical protein
LLQQDAGSSQLSWYINNCVANFRPVIFSLSLLSHKIIY